MNRYETRLDVLLACIMDQLALLLDLWERRDLPVLQSGRGMPQ